MAEINGAFNGGRARRTKKAKRGGGVKIIIIALLFAALVIYLILGNVDFGKLYKNITYGDITFSETGYEYDYDSYMNPSFAAYINSKGYFYATKDGVKFVTETGETKMNVMYSMSSPPLMICAGNVAAVAEQRGNTIYVCGETGELYEAQAKGPIVGFTVNKDGVCGVISQNGDDYLISVYKNTGGSGDNLAFEYSHPSNGSVFPSALAISGDDRILAAVFYDISGIDASSKITFFYLNKSESVDYVNSIYGANDDFSGQLIGFVQFTDVNKLFCATDKQICCIDAENGCKKLWEMDLTNKIDAAYVNNGNFAVSYGDGLVNAGAKPVGLVEIYSMDMEELGSYQADGRVGYISGSDSAFILGSGRDYAAVALDGSVLWKFNALQDLRDVLFIDGANKILIAGETRASVLKGEKQPAGGVPSETEIAG